jgi:hypothetical protein
MNLSVPLGYIHILSQEHVDFIYGITNKSGQTTLDVMRECLQNEFEVKV